MSDFMDLILEIRIIIIIICFLLKLIFCETLKVLFKNKI
jgi:hypothetical protein